MLDAVLLIWACGALLAGSVLFPMARADRELPPWARALMFVVLTILWPVALAYGLGRRAWRGLMWARKDRR